MINFQIHRYGANYSKRIILVNYLQIKYIPYNQINYSKFHKFWWRIYNNFRIKWYTNMKDITKFFSPFVKVTISWKYLSILYFVYLSFYLSFNMVTLNLYKITKKCWEKITNRTLELNSNCQLKFLPLILFIGFKIKLPCY